MHMKIVSCDDSGGCGGGHFILGQFSQPFDSIPQMIHHYTINKLPIKGAEHMSLLHPVNNELLWPAHRPLSFICQLPSASLGHWIAPALVCQRAVTKLLTHFSGGYRFLFLVFEQTSPTGCQRKTRSSFCDACFSVLFGARRLSVKLLLYRVIQFFDAVGWWQDLLHWRCVWALAKNTSLDVRYED